MEKTKKINFNNKLIDSLIDGNIDGITECYNNGADFNRLYAGDTLLIRICDEYGYGFDKTKRYEIVKLLIKYGTRVNMVDGIGLTPLYYTVKDKLKGCMRLLIDAGADINYQNNRFTYLHIDAMNEDMGWKDNNFNIGGSNYLIKNGCKPDIKTDYFTDRRQHTPMEVAIKQNNIATAANLYIYANQDIPGDCMFASSIKRAIERKMKSDGLKRLSKEEVEKRYIESCKLNKQRIEKAWYRSMGLISLCLKYFRRNKISRNDFNMLPRSLRKNLAKSVLGKRKHREGLEKPKKKIKLK